jgi:hypothetical protein
VSDFEETWLDDNGDEWRACWQCGGEGELEGQCTCMEDCCCCLDPEPPNCDLCRGRGALRVSTRASREAAQQAATPPGQVR